MPGGVSCDRCVRFDPDTGRQGRPGGCVSPGDAGRLGSGQRGRALRRGCPGAGRRHRQAGQAGSLPGPGSRRRDADNNLHSRQAVRAAGPMNGKTTGRAGGETADVNDRHSLSHRLVWTSGRLHPGGPAPAAGIRGNTGVSASRGRRTRSWADPDLGRAGRTGPRHGGQLVRAGLGRHPPPCPVAVARSDRRVLLRRPGAGRACPDRQRCRRGRVPVWPHRTAAERGGDSADHRPGQPAACVRRHGPDTHGA